MTQTDTPLKLLVRDFAPTFAAWLLDVDEADVCYVQPLNIELPAGTVRSDTVFRVTLADERVVLLHVEFQGRRSERPVPLRMLDYLSRLAQQESGCLCSAVLYVGDGAGANDEGVHRIECADGSLTLTWHYRVIRLWQMRAEELLALGRPALLALIGQTRIEEPAHVLPQTMATIQQVPDEENRSRLFTALTGLMRDEEVLKMAEQLMEAMDHGLMMDTPFLRRIREEGRVEGRVEGHVEGRAEGRVEGRVEGRMQGLTEGLITLRQSILDIVAARFDPSVTCYRRIAALVETVADPKQLRSVLQAAIQSADVAGFERTLETLAVNS